MTATAIVKKPVLEKLTAARNNIISRLPQGIDSEKYFLTVMTLCQKNPALLACDPDSVLLAAYEAASLGVNMNPTLQLAYVIPYGRTAQFQLGYRGMVQEAYKTGDVKNFFAEVVYENDQFQRQFAPKKNLFHAPPAGDRGAKIGAYALIEFKDGNLEFEYLTTEQIERRRKHSKQPDSLMWSTFWEEGYRKTPIRVLFKRIPLVSQGLERLAEIVSKEAEEELEPEPAGRLELDEDSAIPTAKPAHIEPQATKPPVSMPIPKLHDVFVCIGSGKDAQTTFNGDLRKVLALMGRVGAKLDVPTKTWGMPAARTHELLSLLDEHHITWQEIDANGDPVPQGGSEDEPTVEVKESLFDA